MSQQEPTKDNTPKPNISPTEINAPNKRYWIVSAGNNSEYWDQFREEGRIANANRKRQTRH